MCHIVAVGFREGLAVGIKSFEIAACRFLCLDDVVDLLFEISVYAGRRNAFRKHLIHIVRKIFRYVSIFVCLYFPCGQI